MVLLFAVFIGLSAGLIRAGIKKRDYRFDDLRFAWLVLVAFIIQIAAFNIPSISEKVTDPLAAVLLVGSQALLLIFSILNIKNLSFWPIFTGFLANFAVILLNGGLMPISPETIKKMVPADFDLTYQIGERLGTGKDIVLSTANTRLAFLSDRIVLYDFLRYSTAFSIGDIFIAIGVIWLLWTLGGPKKRTLTERI
jgi:hypothetical protein